MIDDPPAPRRGRSARIGVFDRVAASIMAGTEPCETSGNIRSRFISARPSMPSGVSPVYLVLERTAGERRIVVMRELQDPQALSWK